MGVFRKAAPTSPALKEVDYKELKDIMLAVQTGTPERAKARSIIKEKRRVRIPTLSYVKAQSGYGRNYKPPVHDYAEVARAIDTESFLARSIQKT